MFNYVGLSWFQSWLSHSLFKIKKQPTMSLMKTSVNCYYASNYIRINFKLIMNLKCSSLSNKKNILKLDLFKFEISLWFRVTFLRHIMCNKFLRQRHLMYTNDWCGLLQILSSKNVDIKFSYVQHAFAITFIRYAQNRKLGKPNNLKFWEEQYSQRA